MFVVSLTSKKIRAFAVIGVSIICAAAITVLCLQKCGSKTVSSSTSVNYRASTAKERLSFISQFGWETYEEPDEVCEIIIPEEFDDVYNSYNKIQLAQGLDLSDYCGKRVKRWTYIVTNYPGYEGEDAYVRLNMLVYDGLVIGGDVCSSELDGFMHGFGKE